MKPDLGLESSVPDWLIEYPQLLPILEELGVDYCCGGKSLERACQERGMDAQTVLARLGEVEVGLREGVCHVSSHKKKP